MWSSSNLNADAFLLVYDITSQSSLQQLNYFAELIEVERETRLERGQCWPALMVAGNKCDLQSMRQVGAREGLEWAKAHGCGFMETSAREMVNIEETFAGEFAHEGWIPEKSASTIVERRLTEGPMQRSSSAWSKHEGCMPQDIDPPASPPQ